MESAKSSFTSSNQSRESGFGKDSSLAGQLVKLDFSRLIQQDQESETKVQDLECGICHEFSLNVSECEKCEHIFCDQCIQTWSQVKNECPFKCSPWKTKRAHRIVRKAISELKFHCKYHASGCKTHVALESVTKHEEQDCEYRLVPCSNVQCDKKVQSKSMQEHVQNCVHTKVLCSKCNILTPKSQIDSHNCLTALSDKVQSMEKKLEECYSLMNQQSTQIQRLLDQLQRPQQPQIKPVCLCPANHILMYLPHKDIMSRSITCDICRNMPANRSQGSYRCQTCNFDRCEQCFRSNVVA